MHYKKSFREYVEMQAGDVPATSSDTNALMQWQLTHTDIQTGVSNFVKWYLEFYEKK